MERITGRFRSKDQAERVLRALEEAGFSTDLLNGMLRQRVDLQELGDGDSAEALIVVDAEEGAQADKARTILNSAGALEIQSVHQDWEPEPGWKLTHLGRSTNA